MQPGRGGEGGTGGGGLAPAPARPRGAAPPGGALGRDGEARPGLRGPRPAGCAARRGTLGVSGGPRALLWSRAGFGAIRVFRVRAASPVVLGAVRSLVSNAEPPERLKGSSGLSCSGK